MLSIKHKNALVAFLGTLTVMLLDRCTKLWALKHAQLEQVLLSGPVHFSYELSFNRGVTAGLLYTNTTYGFGVLTLLIVLIIAFLIRHTYIKYMSGASVLAESLVLAGALSNLIDRFVYAGVVDFIKIGYCGTKTCLYWPSFNIADAAIVLGVLGIYVQENFKDY